MADIRHLIRIKSTPPDVFKLLSTRRGIASWWTPRVDGEHIVGNNITLHFGDWDGRTELRVVQCVPYESVVWEVVANNEGDEWPGTRIRFDLEGTGNETLLRFRHSGWRAATDNFAECNVFWGHFMQEIKRFVESSEEKPLLRQP